MITLSRDLLERSPEETARRLGLSLWDEAGDALGRLERGEDGEALHDFRVALRRLRSVLRAYRRFLRGSRPRKLRRLVSTLASSTNAARDAEVQLEWLQAQGTDPAQKLHDHLTTRQRIELPASEALREDYERAGKTLEASLARMKLADDVEGAESFLTATGKLLEERGGILKASLDAIASAEEAEKLHRTRIQAKRLRYLLEPLQGEVRRARPLVKKMKGLQDCLGDLQDTRVMTETIASALEHVALDEARRLRDEALGRGRNESEGPGEAAERSPMTSAGLYELLEAQRERRDGAFAELSRAWLGEAARAFFDEVTATAEELAVKTTKLFLLTGLPEPVAGTSAVTVQQGWMPGKSIVEHVRSERRGRRTRYIRAVEIAGRVTEEPLKREAFEALWPLTEGRRLERRLYEVGACAIDVVEAKNLVLARAEALPDWLQPWVVREITGSKRYQLESVTRARSAPGKSAGPRDESP